MPNEEKQVFPCFYMHNVNGMSSRESKRKEIIKKLERERPWGFIIIDGRPRPGSERISYKFANYNNLHAGYVDSITNTTSRGVSIFTSNKLNIKAERITQWQDGNFLLVSLLLCDMTIVLGGVYGPNKPARDFYNRIKLAIEATRCDLWFLIGDFNIVTDPKLDCHNYSEPENTHP